MAQTAVSMCAEHKETLIMLCMDCSHKYVCTKCIATTHQGHKFIDRESYFKVRMANLEHLIKKAETKTDDICREFHTVKKYRHGNKNNKDKVISDITMKGDRIKNMVDEWVNKHVNNSERMYYENEESIDSFEKYLTDLLENLQSTVKSCKSVSPPSPEFASLEEKLKSQIDAPHDKEPSLKQVEFVQSECTPFNLWDFLGSLNVEKMQLSIDVEIKRQLKACEIDRKLISVLKEIERNHQTTVYKGTYSGSPCIIKTHKGQDRITEMELFFQEAMLLRTLHHPKVVQLYGVSTSRPVCFVTECMSFGNLSEYLSSQRETLLLPSLTNIAAQIAEGMIYISSQRILHRDLRAANILVNDADAVKISNFSLAVRLEDKNTTWSPDRKYDSTLLPVKWTAPEGIQELIFSSKSDVWSFGIVLWEIMSFGDLPFKGIANSEVIDTQKEIYPLHCPQACPEMIYNEVMVKCWNFSPEERPAFSSIHLLLKDFKIIQRPLLLIDTKDVSKPTSREPNDDTLKRRTLFGKFFPFVKK